ncbi:MAG: ATP-binding protein [Ktedonobacterales bacterium]
MFKKLRHGAQRRDKLLRVAFANFGFFGGVRARLTLWYLAILALVFLVFGVILVNVVAQNSEVTQRKELTFAATRLAATYSAADGQLHVDRLLSAHNLPAKTPAPAAELPGKSAPYTYALPLARDGFALLLTSQDAVTQEIGPLTPAGMAQARQMLLNVSLKNSAQIGQVGLGATSAYDGFQIAALSVADIPGQPMRVVYSVYISSITSGGKQAGTLLVGEPEVSDQTRQSVAQGLLVAGPITLLVAAVGGYWLASRAMRPVRLITRAAQEIGATDLSRRLRLKQRDELGELASTFDTMLDRLEAAFARQRQFTADASHELRTPLTIVNLEVSHALAAPRTTDEYAQALITIQAENLAMSRLVDDLLTLARADAGVPHRGGATVEPLDLSDLALEAVERMAPLAQQRGVTLLAGDLPETPIMGECALLTRALVNLVENGVKYTAGVGTLVTVAVGSQRDAQGQLWASATISDDGPGIDAAHIPHLFDRFYRADAARTRDTGQPIVCEVDEAMEVKGGSGLGLAIAQWAAEAHGGRIEICSTAGNGSTFTLLLPQCGISAVP